MSAGDVTPGRRMPDGIDWSSDLPSGAYWYVPGVHRGSWLCITPNGAFGNLARHDVTEHEDGTITVSPSILVYQAGDLPGWHGYLERGVWREV